MSASEYIVKFKKDQNPAEFLEQLKKEGAEIISDNSTSKVFPHATVKMQQSLTSKTHESVDYIEPNGEMKTQ